MEEKNSSEFSLTNILESIGVIWYYARRLILENLFPGYLLSDTTWNTDRMDKTHDKMIGW